MLVKFHFMCILRNAQMFFFLIILPSKMLHQLSFYMSLSSAKYSLG